MTLELSKEDMICLVSGSQPYYSVMNLALIKDKGRYNDYRSEWEWDKHKLRELSELELFSIYHICKNSWADV